MHKQHTKALMSESSKAMVYEPSIIKQGENSLYDARLLHKDLKSKYQFSDWVKAKITNTLFKEGIDYFSEKTEKLGVGRKGLTFLLTLDTCKHIAMLENNEIGYKVRATFIAKEKELRGISQLPKESQLFKGLKAKTFNGRKMYPYVELLERAGYKRTNNYAGRKARYWMHFVKDGKLNYITEEFALHLYHSRRVLDSRKVMLAAQPVIPSRLGDSSFLLPFKN
jgi:phage anti-repressor protein